MRSLLIAAIGAAALLTACETVPEQVNMDPASFQSAVSDANSAWHPYASVQKLTQILNTQTLSPAQRARVQYERGRIRTESAIELPDAIQDLRAASSINATPADGDAAPVAASIPDTAPLIRIAEAKLNAARGRLNGLQTLPEWFDDKVATSAVAEAAERFRKSGLAPDPFDAGLLEAGGYLCRSSSAGRGEWNYGENISHLSDLDWCTTTETS
ncbi:hypothetical protein [Henriciella marina]|uniref:hypothetical protein n=1 Tax=Henriciella marina TaxID=453851 RepID=UPI00038146BC|nr:hypothetical protein [Henriciella marina]